MAYYKAETLECNQTANDLVAIESYNVWKLIVIKKWREKFAYLTLRASKLPTCCIPQQKKHRPPGPLGFWRIIRGGQKIEILAREGAAGAPGICWPTPPLKKK